MVKWVLLVLKVRRGNRVVKDLKDWQEDMDLLEKMEMWDQRVHQDL
jgi:hypothetical protein